jgi:signal peptidase I
MTWPDKDVMNIPEETGQAEVDQPPTGSTVPQSSPDPALARSASAGEPRQLPHRGETLAQSFLSIIVIVLFVITFIVQAFQIPSESMERTLLVGDYLLVDKVHFGQGRLWNWVLPYRTPQHGDIIVFHYPVDPAQHFVKRVVGLPGDHIRLGEKTLFVNGLPLEEDYAIRSRRDYDAYRDNFPSGRDTSGQVDPEWRSRLPKQVQNAELVVPRDEYFVMGDNRDHSLDSRYWGFVPRNNIEGRPLVIYLSVRQHPEEETAGGNDKLFSSGHLLSHVWQFARWDRMFHLVR